MEREKNTYKAFAMENIGMIGKRQTYLLQCDQMELVACNLAWAAMWKLLADCWKNIFYILLHIYVNAGVQGTYEYVKHKLL